MSKFNKVSLKEYSNRILFGLIILMVGLLNSLYVGKNASAGSINSNEASVLSAAGSVFEYNGSTYVAASAYLDKLRNRLLRDDTDLTAEQATAAIGLIYDNVDTGVEEGYLVKTGEVAQAGQIVSQPTSEPEPTKKPKKDKKKKDENNDELVDVYTDESIDKIVNATMAPTPTSDAEQATYINPEEDMEIIDNDVSQLDVAGDQFQFETSVPVTTAEPSEDYKFDIDVDAASNKVKLIKQSSAETVSETIKNDFIMPIFKMFCIISIILFVLMLVYLVFKKKFNIKKILTSSLGLLLILAGVVGISLSVISAYCFNSEDVLISDIAQEKYYNKVYKELDENVNNMMVAAGFPDDVLSELINERSVYISGKLAVEASFNKNRSTDFLDVQKTVYEILSHDISNKGYYYTEEVKDNTTAVSELVQTVYRDSLKFTYAQKMYDLKKENSKKLLTIGLCSFVLLILGILLLFLTQKYIHRITRLSGFAMLICSASMLVSVIYYKISGKINSLDLTPGNYRDFFAYYLKHAETFIIAVGVLIIFAAISLIAATYLLKSTNKKNKFVKIKL